MRREKREKERNVLAKQRAGAMLTRAAWVDGSGVDRPRASSEATNYYHDVTADALRKQLEARSAGRWLQAKNSSRLLYNLSYVRAAVENGTVVGREHITIVGRGHCPPPHELDEHPTLVFMKTLSNTYEQRMFAIFQDAMIKRGLRSSMAHDRRHFNLCYIEPEFLSTSCNRTRRCIDKFQQGVLLKVAFVGDVLLRLLDGALVVFTDTDAVAIRYAAYSIMLKSLDSSVDVRFMAASPGPNTGVFVVRRTETTARFWEQWWRSMMADQERSGPGRKHDQGWTDVLLKRINNVGAATRREAAWGLKWRSFEGDQVTGSAGLVTNCTLVYHAIHTRDYPMKAALAESAVRRTGGACAAGEQPAPGALHGALHELPGI